MLVVTNEPLMGCRQHWGKNCIYATDTFDETFASRDALNPAKDIFVLKKVKCTKGTVK